MSRPTVEIKPDIRPGIRHRTFATRPLRRRAWWEAMKGMLAVSPVWPDPRWVADETGGFTANWALLAEDQR